MLIKLFVIDKALLVLSRSSQIREKFLGGSFRLLSCELYL